MQGLINFRDFGGEQNASGQRVRTGQLFRCGHLAFAEAAAVERLTGIDFRVIADLRYASERQIEPSPWPVAYGERILWHGGEKNEDAPHHAMLSHPDLSVARVAEIADQFYRELPFDPLYRGLFARTIRRFAEQGGPVLIHCAAGKDRTGVLAALILHCLGVPQGAIVAEYLRSSRAPTLLAMKPEMIARAKTRYGVDVPGDAVEAMLDAKAEYLSAAFGAIERRCGSIDTYLAEEGVDAAVRQQLVDQFIER